jgi:hypothetical protein
LSDEFVEQSFASQQVRGKLRTYKLMNNSIIRADENNKEN